MAWLTKSRFLSGLQCHKRLWFEVHQPLEVVVEPNTAILQGRAFDEAVQRLAPGVVIRRDAGMPAAIADTKRVLGKPKSQPSLVYQAAFRAGGLAVITDVLRRAGARFDLVEVKASTGVKETHLADVAFQTLVLERAKIPVDRVFIGHVNSQFVLRRAGDYAGLLAEEDVTDRVRAYLPEAASRAVELQDVMASESMPAIDVGPHCSNPYECPFFARCTAGQPSVEYPVTDLPRGGKAVEALVASGFKDLRDVPVGRLTHDLHQRVYDATCSGLAFFDLAATAELRSFTGPFAYLDFETIAHAVPEVIGARPYEPLPFQWSVHVENSPQELRHAEFLAVESFGDFAAMATALIAALPQDGPIFAYNASVEMQVLLRLAELAPDHEDPLHALADRLFDLLPVARAAYYHRDMRGSWSIKSVMPTIDAALTYDRLDSVQEGDGAQRTFLALRDGQLSDQATATLRAALLKYCRHDTWVMVVLRRFLCGEPLGLPG